MKKTVLLLFTLVSIISYSQSPISSFYTEDGVGLSVVTSLNPIDQTASGINQTWNFNQLTTTGISVYTNTNPTAIEISTFPNTNAVIGNISSTNTGITTAKVYTKNIDNVVSITGLTSTGLELNFITNNATLGAFPMNYGFANNDPVSGNYSFQTYSGTFTGTINTTVDAYGTLNRTVDGLLISDQVTRLKTEIIISLNYSFLSNVGTITQTTYSYYTNTTTFGQLAPVFRSATTKALVPLASIDQTNISMESFTAFLNNDSFDTSNNLKISPNPVKDFLNIELEKGQKIKSVSIVDANGRTLLNKNSFENDLNVSHLQKGIYFVIVNTNNGRSYTNKIIKN